jgi:phenylacetate-coenzyme A ligase PaaK-like adenylate-forming protein
MEIEIPKPAELEQKVFNIHNEKEFESIALQTYHFQYTNNLLYRDYCDAVKKTPASVKELADLPFLPISFFKTHRIETSAFDPELVFKSSGTTGSQTSSHFVKSASLYRESFSACFREFFGDPRDYCILGLLPSYLERGNSSLVYMVKELVKESSHAYSGFYLDEFTKLDKVLKALEASAQKTILFGVSFGLLDFSGQFPQELKHTIVLETGGMKGRREEMTKEELYAVLKKKFGVGTIYSEYGMTELLSQAYAVDGRFRSPRHLRILLRDESDPFLVNGPGTGTFTGAINIIDLANLYSCSFIASDDLGKLYPDGSFEILGRLDHSDIRGCSQMIS